MTTSTPAKASSPANISPVGPPPAITTACSVMTHGQHDSVACGKPPPSRYASTGGEGYGLISTPALRFLRQCCPARPSSPSDLGSLRRCRRCRRRRAHRRRRRTALQPRPMRRASRACLLLPQRRLAGVAMYAAPNRVLHEDPRPPVDRGRTECGEGRLVSWARIPLVLVEVVCGKVLRLQT